MMQEELTHNVKLSMCGRDRVERGKNWCIWWTHAWETSNLERIWFITEPSPYCLPLPRASPAPLPFGEEGRCKKKNCGEILGCQENFLLLICFVHPVLLVLGLAELAALGYGSGVVVAQVVKVRLIAVIVCFNLYAVLFHGKFSSLTFTRIL